ncbi:MAG: FHA domain-containing protein [Aphanothece sp. CMT-3BRIN-NPC111]|jgi:hypothetical protein|nr:FHA domain-containing protein [Aphanothece sp. CMT-3BRIN-NPC111]
MSPKIDKLDRRVQEIHTFIATRINQDATYSFVAQELGNISNYLKTGKLTIQIYSRFPLLSQALQKFLSTSQKLPNLYHFKIDSIPSQSQLTTQKSPAALILQSYSNIGQQQTRYPLSTTQKVVIGRRPDCQIKIPDNYAKVSGHHAEIKLISSHPSPSWQICDLNAVNGTYINGIKLQGCQTLQPGDRISLAYPSAHEKSIEFIFECQPNAASEHEDEIDCDVLCLVVNPNQPISADEKQFIEKYSKTQSAKLIVVADISGTSNQTTNFAGLKTGIQNQIHNLLVDVVPLLLRPFYPNGQVSTIDSNSQVELDNFCQSLETLAKGEAENIIIKRTTTKLLFQLAIIERILNSQELVLIKEIQKLEAELEVGGQSELKEQIRKAIKKANDEKDKFFRQAKVDLVQSKSVLLDEFNKHSILTQIKVFIDNLRPFVARQGGYSYIRLWSESASNPTEVSNTITYICRYILIQWGTEEWQRICTVSAEGGLNGLVQRIYNMVNLISAVRLSDLLLQQIPNIDIERSLQFSVVEAASEVRYQEVSLAGYLLKNTKSQVTSLVTTIVWVIGAIAAFTGGGKLGNKAIIVAGLTMVALIFIIPFLVYNYHQEKVLRLEQEGEKLKKDLCSYHQSLSKSLVDKLVQAFNMRLEAEERRLKEVLDTANEQFTAYLVELEKCQALIKSRLVEYKARQTDLKKEKVDLEKLKQI